MPEQIIEIIISELDFYLIERVRELRLKATPYMSQVALSVELGVSEGYIAKVENPKERSKYNIRILSKLAKALKLKSYADFFPQKPLTNDIVRIRMMLIKRRKGKIELESETDRGKSYEVISVTPLKDAELEKWNNNSLPYLKYIKK